MTVVTFKCINWKKKTVSNPLIQLQLFVFDMLTSQKKHFHRQVLSIRVLSAMNTNASRGQLKPIRIWENLVVNYNTS